MLKVIYIIAPFRAPTHWGIVQNVRVAEAAALEVWRLGAAALCPHLNTQSFQGALSDEAWLEGDLEMLRRCDAVLCVGQWQASKGSVAEVEEAIRRGIEVFPDLHHLKEWLDAND